MSDIDEKKIEEVLTRLLEGPVGDALCAKIVTQVGRDLDKAMEPYLTKAEYDREGKEAAEKFAEGMAESSEQMEGFFENVASYGLRIHNLEALQAVNHYSSLNQKEALELEMGLMTRIRTRVLEDLDSWTSNPEIHEHAKTMMMRIIKFLRPQKGTMN
jgi:hypothetical protein